MLSSCEKMKKPRARKATITININSAPAVDLAFDANILIAATMIKIRTRTIRG